MSGGAREPVAEQSAPFIVGVPRSGTTLLRLMLDAHPALSIPPETWFLLRVIRLRDSGRASREALFKAVTTLRSWKAFQLSDDAYRRALEQVEPFDLADGVRAFYRLYAAEQGKQRWGDKTPGYASQIDAIGSLLPEARFVHVIRDGRDVVLSLRPLWFAPARDITALARFWRDTIETVRRLGQAQSCLEIRYEDLVRDPRPQLERIGAFVGLPYDRAMERYFESARERLVEVRSPGVVAAVRRTSEPPDPSRIGRWRTEMTAAELSEFDAAAGHLLDELGYQA